MTEHLIKTALFAACLCLLIKSLDWGFLAMFGISFITLLIGEWYFEKNR